MQCPSASRVGVLITHGTDTLEWTHAFLRYAVKNNHANIVLTGSQIPLPGHPEFSDAYENLENSLRFMVELVPPNILTVFNYGEDAFSDSLRKINRWGNIAFVGDRVARMECDEVREHDSSIGLSTPCKMEKLYLITTGGTIEAEETSEGVLVPGRNHVLSYIAGRFSDYFQDLCTRSPFAIDSSDLTCIRLRKLASLVVRCLKETNPSAYADLFEENVRIVYTDPFKKREEYEKEVDGASGVVIAGYGGGNLPMNASRSSIMMPVVREPIRKHIPVVLSSQVPLGVADYVHANGFKPISSGVFSGVDLSLPECQVRLSYVLGHRNALEQRVEQEGIDFLPLIESLFMSGMKFRTRRSRMVYEKLRGRRFAQDDLLVGRPFDVALDCACQTSCKEGNSL
ncbi:MAG: asparaginase domain-containing protein [candidate division KSB1 bacterium]|nr:asparaginase domain-containing protein [candidate division KSB1 bacterium]